MINNNLRLVFIIIISFGFIYGLSSCKKEDDSSIGMNIIPGDDVLSLFRDTVNIDSYTVRTQNVLGENKRWVPLGSYVDPVFGTSEASMAFQVRLSGSNVNFNNVSTLNSLELHLKLYSSYGDSLQPQNIRINRLLTDIDTTTTYYSDFKLNPGDYEYLSTASITIDPTDSARIVKLPLPIELAEAFIDPTNNSHFRNDTTFMEFFKGLFLIPESPANDGCIFTFGLLDNRSRMVMTYNDTATYNFLIDSRVAVVKMLDHDYSVASPELISAIQDSTTLNEFCYIQGLGGMVTKIDLSSIKSISDTLGKISVNRAKLFLNVKGNNEEDKYLPPPKLALMKRNDDGKTQFIVDQIINEKIFDGSFDKTDYNYEFNLSIHVQELIKSENNYELYILPLPARNQSFPHRTVLYGNTDEVKRPKLEIYYTKY